MEQNRYIYHYNCESKEKPAGWSGIAQLTFKIKSHDDLQSFKRVLTEKWGDEINAILSLSYLGREND